MGVTRRWCNVIDVSPACVASKDDVEDSFDVYDIEIHVVEQLRDQEGGEEARLPSTAPRADDTVDDEQASDTEPEREPHPVRRRQRGDEDEQPERAECDDRVADAELLGPVPKHRRGRPV